MKRVLVAGIGNIFMGDDGFGCEVAQQLSRTPLPDGVDVVDFGIRGMDLSYALMEGYDAAVLVDAMQRGAVPGTVSVVEPEIDAAQVGVVESGEHLIAPHAMDPVKVLRFVATLGEKRPRVLLVVCEPETLGGEEGYMGLSTAVATAVEQAVSEIRSMAEELTRDVGSVCRNEKASRKQLWSEAAPGGMI
ncbi:MAG: hydrogenase maturation protease [Gammaproteobacteria bacterium]